MHGSRRPALALTFVPLFIAVLVGAAVARTGDGNPLGAGPAPEVRTVSGDLCVSPFSLPRSGTVTVDLCQAWNDYDPGVFGCTGCELPGPDVVAVLETQVGEKVRVSVRVISGSPAIHCYLATDCNDIVDSCIAASPADNAPLETTMTVNGTVYVVIDTTSECGTVEISREQAATTVTTTFSALKAVYR